MVISKKEIITDVAELARLLKLDLTVKSEINANFSSFPLKVPRAFALRMRKEDSTDPLLLQILPQIKEQQNLQDNKRHCNYSIDPLQESKFSPINGLLHKYQSRVLLLLTKNCPINCRFCFRRHLREQVEDKDWQKIFAYISGNKSITEVILSGGEPLLWQDKDLKWLCQKLSAIKHLHRLRVHTRMPILMPQRITNQLLQVLKEVQTKLKIVFVIHCNHPHEIDKRVKKALAKLRNNNIALFNQSVLLKGINDNFEVLVALSEKLFQAQVIPYYLHLLDKVAGAEHFFVSEKRAKGLLRQMAKILPGYLVPKLAREVAGACAKQLLAYGI